MARSLVPWPRTRRRVHTCQCMLHNYLQLARFDRIDSHPWRSCRVQYEAPTYALRNGRTWLTLFPVPHSHHGHSDASRPLLNFRSAAGAGYRPEYVPPRMPAPIADAHEWCVVVQSNSLLELQPLKGFSAN